MCMHNYFDYFLNLTKLLSKHSLSMKHLLLAIYSTANNGDPIIYSTSIAYIHTEISGFSEVM